MDFIEPNAIAAIISVALSKAQLAARENVGDGLGNFPHLVFFNQVFNVGGSPFFSNHYPGVVQEYC
jgi:hypothetical protein